MNRKEKKREMKKKLARLAQSFSFRELSRWKNEWMDRGKGQRWIGNSGASELLRLRERRVIGVISWSASCQLTTPLEANQREGGQSLKQCKTPHKHIHTHKKTELTLGSYNNGIPQAHYLRYTHILVSVQAQYSIQLKFFEFNFISKAPNHSNR